MIIIRQIYFRFVELSKWETMEGSKRTVPYYKCGQMHSTMTSAEWSDITPKVC